MSFPPAPLGTVDWNKLGLSIQDNVNGHVESKYSAMTGEWSEPEFVQDPYMRVHGLAPALNYGQQAYEGLKAHRGPDGNILLFRPTDHADRLAVSASYVSIPEIPQDHFMKCVKFACARNAEWIAPHTSEALMYIRPLVFGSSGHLMLTAPTEYTFAVYVQPGTTYHGVQPLPACVIDDFDRAAPRGTGGAKVGGNYAPVIRHTDKARAQGFHVTLHLDAQTRTCIEEFSTSGFIGIKKAGGHVTVVVPDSKNIVQSITSDSCLTLAKSFGWTVEKREIPWSECKFFDEVIAVGTAASLLPIRLLVRPGTGEKFVYGETTGECTLRLGEALRGIMRGKMEDTFGWVVRIEEKDLLAREVVEEVEIGVSNGIEGDSELVVPVDSVAPVDEVAPVGPVAPANSVPSVEHVGSTESVVSVDDIISGEPASHVEVIEEVFDEKVPIVQIANVAEIRAEA